MKIKVIVFLLAFVLVVTDAVCSSVQNVIQTNDQAKIQLRMEKTGGFIVIPAKGKISLVNLQKRLSTEKLKGRAEIITEILTSPMVLESASSFSIESAKAEMRRKEANVAFFVIDDPHMPMSLVALEEAWAMINIAKLADGDVNEKVLTRRFGVELNRVVRALLGVGENGRRPAKLTSVRNAPTTGKDLDAIEKVGIPMDEAIAIHANMAAFGIVPERKTTYLRACKQGWAPEPTNDLQKAIWEKVHAMPVNPMKIEFDPKKGR